MIYFPFDSEEVTTLDGVTYDRAVDSDVLADYFATFFTNGIDSTISENLQVKSVSGEMAVIVSPGKILINGRYGYEESQRKLSIQASEDQDRIDRVVARLNKLDRTIDLYVVKGTKGTVPVAPALTREGDIYELSLATIFVSKLSTEIKQDRITDTRLDTNLCGLISFTGEKVDTTSIFNQFQSALDQYLELVDSAIDGTLAGQLQNQIDDIKEVQEITLSNTTATTFNVSVSGITQNDSPEIYVKTIHLSSVEDKQKAQEEFNKIIEATTGANSITFLLSEPLSQSITVCVKGR